MKRKLLISSGKQNKQLPKKLQTPTPFNNTRAVSADILLTPRRVRGTAKGERFQLRCANRPFISLLTFNAFHSPGHQVSLSLSQGFLSRSSSLSLQWAPAEGLPPSCSCRSSWERGVLNKGKMLSHIKDQDRSGKGLKEEALSASLVAQLVKDLPAVQETPV